MSNMSDRQRVVGTITDQQLLLLFIDWLGVLLTSRFGAPASGSNGKNTWTFTLKDKSRWNIERDEASGVVYISTPEQFATQAFELAKEALKKTNARDVGEPSWWVVGLESQGGISEISFFHMIRSLSEHKRFQGNWRLGGDALLRFTQKNTEHPPLFPNQQLDITFRSVGPGYGPFSRAIAQEVAAKIRAVVVFATGAPFHGVSMIWPAEEQERAETQESLSRATVPELHVDKLPLWPALSTLLTPGNQEAFDRAIGAMFAYEHGLLQKTDPAAIVFFITAMEALSVPNAPWQIKRVAKRFQEFLLTACPKTVESTMRHANFVQSFGKVKRPKDFINQLYTLRSRPVHTGQLDTYIGFEQIDQTIRIALVSQLARSAITEFIRRPFSLLWGHPEIDPAVELRFSRKEYVILKEQAKRAKKDVADWIRLAAVAKAKEDLDKN